MKQETAVVANDFHGQFRDKKVCGMFHNFLRMVKPDKLILAGDIMDCASISRFIKNAERKEDLQDEFDDCHELLWELRHSVPKNTKIIYIEGNHEARLIKYLNSNAPAIATLRTNKIAYQLKFKELGITYSKDGIWLGDLFVYHGSLVRNKSSYSAHAELAKNGCSGISGHCHRDGKAAVRQRGGQLCWWENFCMCDLSPDYIEGIADWTQGWSLVTLIGKRPYVEQVAVLGGKYIFRGKIYCK